MIDKYNEIFKTTFGLIEQYEGFKNCAYLCPSGKLTIGYGTTIYSNGMLVKENDKITKEMAKAEVFNFCKKYCYPEIVDLQNNCFNNLNTFQQGALMSLIYNVGAVNFHKSNLRNLILSNARQEQIIVEWLKWIYSNGMILDGLINRRKEELKVFFSSNAFRK